MAWRLARSLVVLQDEIEAVAPGTTVWTIGDEDHQTRASDHNPNPAGVVCAADILGNAALDLMWLAERIRTGGHPAAKYVIYADRIASATRGWRWRPYSGTFHNHVHVSVGVGPDGQSTGPYDDTSPWGLIEEGSEVEITELIQRAVEAAGHDPGPVDGQPGPKTLAGLTAALKAAGQPGPPGPPGPPGKTPTRVAISGDVVEVE